MRLSGQLIESIEREDDPDAFDKAIAYLRAAPIWTHVRPKILNPSPTAELRVSRTLANGAVVGASRHDHVAPKTVRRSLVIAPYFHRTMESHEVSLVELLHAFSGNIERVIYWTTPGAERAEGRIRRLGGVAKGPVPGGLNEWHLTQQLLQYRPITFPDDDRS